jgi:hypothetical protein
VNSGARRFADGKPWHFKYLTVNHIYSPLAQSSGKILTLLRRAHKARGGDRARKLFQFLNEVGARALRMHLGRVLEMAESSPNKYAYERKIVERFGGQQELELVVPSAPPDTVPPPASIEDYHQDNSMPDDDAPFPDRAPFV